MNDDLISRQSILKAINNMVKECDSVYVTSALRNLEVIVADMPSAQPEIVRCKDCKHWKDSDGTYRRGREAESKCPVNSKAVYDGIWYCADAERRTDG